MQAFKTVNKMELGIAAGAILLGLVILIDSLTIKLGSGYDRIGPRFFPYVVAAGLLISGSLMIAELLLDSVRRDTEPLNKTSLFILISGLVLCIILLKPAGFIIAATVQFWLVARAFSNANPLRDAITAVLLSISVYFIFTRGLGLVLPLGMLAGLI